MMHVVPIDDARRPLIPHLARTRQQRNIHGIILRCAAADTVLPSPKFMSLTFVEIAGNAAQIGRHKLKTRHL